MAHEHQTLFSTTDRMACSNECPNDHCIQRLKDQQGSACQEKIKQLSSHRPTRMKKLLSRRTIKNFVHIIFPVQRHPHDPPQCPEHLSQSGKRMRRIVLHLPALISNEKTQPISSKTYLFVQNNCGKSIEMGHSLGTSVTCWCSRK